MLCVQGEHLDGMVSPHTPSGGFCALRDGAAFSQGYLFYSMGCGPKSFYTSGGAPWIWFFCCPPGLWRGLVLLVTFQYWKVTKDCRGGPPGF